MKTVGIVVLNYINYKETIECINSILKQQGVEYHIALVDNGSPNESMSILMDIYSNNARVTIIPLKDNIGYAKGNNIGIAFLRKKGYDFVFVANSDIALSTEKILTQLLNGYEPGVGVINPIIKNLNGTIDQRVSYKKNLLYLRILKHFLYKIIGHSVSDKPANMDGSIEFTKKLTGLQKDRYVISGSGFILTPDFFSSYKGLYPETFLYYEEWATILLLEKANLYTKIVVCDDVIHKGAASTPNDIKKHTKFRKKIEQQSARKIIKLMFTTYKRASKCY